MTKKIKTIIIDDEKLARDVVKSYLRKNSEIDLVGECSDGFDAVKKINDLKPDLIFLDIQMPKITGFEMLELIENPPIIIFTTAFDQYALKAFEVNATDYLLKPFTQERFNEALSKAIMLISEKSTSTKKIASLVKHVESKKEPLERVVVKMNQKISVIPIDDIHYLESQDDYVMIYSSKGNFLKQKTMKFFEEHLNPIQFIRVHRSYIVKIDQIKQIELLEKESYKITLIKGNQLPVSKTGYQKLKEIFN
ncbi:MAG: response regulator [Ignavibacteria bacterium]|nr:response regulator [Ignavibacteria bacterium]